MRRPQAPGSGVSDTTGRRSTGSRLSVERITPRGARPFPDKKRTEQIYYILNFFEELAGLYNRGLVDADLTRVYLGHFALLFWNGLSWWWIRRLRAQPGQGDLFEELRKMCADIEEANAYLVRLGLAEPDEFPAPERTP